jgi:hypothetical protein
MASNPGDFPAPQAGWSRQPAAMTVSTRATASHRGVLPDGRLASSRRSRLWPNTADDDWQMFGPNFARFAPFVKLACCGKMQNRIRLAISCVHTVTSVGDPHAIIARSANRQIRFCERMSILTDFQQHELTCTAVVESGPCRPARKCSHALK